MIVMEIEAAITRLIRDAPTVDRTTIAGLIVRLRDVGGPLALAIARIVELVDAGVVDPGIALPALAMACATLGDATLGARELEAARYEVETLLPVPDRAAPGIVVPVANLTRGSRPRT